MEIKDNKTADLLFGVMMSLRFTRKYSIPLVYLELEQLHIQYLKY